MPKSSLPEEPSMPKAVIDTNLFVRGLLKGPVTVPLLQAWKEHRFKLVTSEFTDWRMEVGMLRLLESQYRAFNGFVRF